MKKNEQLIFFIFSICHKWLIPDVLIYEMLLKDVDFLLCDNLLCVTDTIMIGGNLKDL